MACMFYIFSRICAGEPDWQLEFLVPDLPCEAIVQPLAVQMLRAVQELHDLRLSMTIWVCLKLGDQQFPFDNNRRFPEGLGLWLQLLGFAVASPCFSV